MYERVNGNPKDKRICMFVCFLSSFNTCNKTWYHSFGWVWLHYSVHPIFSSWNSTLDLGHYCCRVIIITLLIIDRNWLVSDVRPRSFSRFIELVQCLDLSPSRSYTWVSRPTFRYIRELSHVRGFQCKTGCVTKFIKKTESQIIKIYPFRSKTQKDLYDPSDSCDPGVRVYWSSYSRGPMVS